MKILTSKMLLIASAIVMLGFPVLTVAEESSLSLLDKALPPELKPLFSTANDIAAAYSGVSTAIDVTNKLLTLVGILEPGKEGQQLAAIHQHIDALGTALDWKVTASDQDRRLAMALAAVQTAGQAVILSMPVTLHTEAAQNSSEALVEAKQPRQFERVFVERATNNTTSADNRWSWKWIIKDRPQLNSQGFVYDWRVGVPPLMQLIPLRLHVIAAIDSNFRNSGAFNKELLDHRSALLYHRTKMMDGVRCGYKSWPVFTLPPASHETKIRLEHEVIDVDVACADIYTGLTAIGSFKFNRRQYVNDLVSGRDNWPSIERTIINPLRERLYREVLAKMPLLEIQAMADTLNQLVYGLNTCKEGYVWRQASQNDFVCVTVEMRAQAQDDNNQADARRNPDGGPDACFEGFVWREAFPGDHVCVTGQTRDQTMEDNRLAESRRLPLQ